MPPVDRKHPEHHHAHGSGWRCPAHLCDALPDSWGSAPRDHRSPNPLPAERRSEATESERYGWHGGHVLLSLQCDGLSLVFLLSPEIGLDRSRTTENILGDSPYGGRAVGVAEMQLSNFV